MRRAQRLPDAALRVQSRAALENRDGLLVKVSPGEPLDEEKEFRVQGGVVQLGLNHEQIDAMEERIHNLLEGVDAGEIELF
jgi:hypothetical protein